MKAKMKGSFDMKKIISAVVSLMMCFSLGAAYSAADEINYTVNGNDISVQPYYSGDVLMVPADETAQALGYICEYNASLGRLIIDDDYIQKAVMFKGSDEAFFDGRLKVINMTREYILSGKTEERNGTVYVSADLFEAFFNTVTVSGNSIDISPAMNELE